MKKALVAIAALIVVTVGVIVYFALSSIDSIVKAAVEQVGSDVTGTDVTLDDVEISLSDGFGALQGFRMTNPKGFAEGEAFAFDEVSVEIDIATIASDPVVIKQVIVQAPRITYALGKSSSNMDEIKKNVDDYDKPDGETKASAGEEGPNIVIENLYLRDGTITVAAPQLSDQELAVPLPDIHMTDIGKENNGATPAEVASQTMGGIIDAAGQAVASVDIEVLTKQAGELASRAAETMGENAGEAQKALEETAEGAQEAIKKLFD
jgi:uncharacterized protein involved in outer membrane biogenesis